MRPDDGYTLSEVLIVLVIMALMSTLGPPAVQRMFPKMMIEQQSQKITSDIAAMRRRAMERGEIYHFKIEPSAQRYILMTGDAIWQKRRWPKAFIMEQARTGQDLGTARGSSAGEAYDDIFTAFPDGRLYGGPLRLEYKSHEVSLSVHPAFQRILVSNYAPQ